MRNMAKLQDVKVIDMVDGEVTKVAYNGEEYKLTEDEAQVGDIMRPNGTHFEHNIMHYKYYDVIEVSEGSICVIDEEGYRNGIGKRHADIFRKEEQYREISRDARVGDFLKFEDDADIPGYVSHGHYYEIFGIDWNDDPQILDDDGDNYDTYEKDFTVYEKVSDEAEVQTDESVVGESIEVVRSNHSKYGGYAGMGKFGQGLVNIGAKGEIASTSDSGVFVKIDKDTVEGERASAYDSDLANFFLEHGEYEVVPNDGVVEGDYVVAKDSADGSYIITNTNMIIGRVAHDHGNGSIELTVLDHSNDYEIGETFDVESMYFEKAPQVVIEGYLRSQLKEGDKVRLLNGGGEYPLFGFTDGEIYEVVNISLSHGHYDPINSVAIGNHGGGFALPSQLELVTESTEDHEETGERLPKPGDKIRITNPYMSKGEYDEGDILTVKKFNPETEFTYANVRVEEFEVPSVHLHEFEYVDEIETTYDKPARVGDTIRITDAHIHNASNGDYVNGDVMKVIRIDTDGDVNKTDKYEGVILGKEFEIIGRDVSQSELSTVKRKAKKGDIVRVTGSSSGHDLGTIGEVVDVTSDGVVLVEAMYKGGTEEFYEHYVEVVARKEDRIDV